MKNTPTPHIGAQYGELAETVILAGHPLRVKSMSEKYLENPVCFNNVRGMLGFTGTYKGKRISVMGHGMGMASIGIYTYELYNFYGVKTIIRVGSAGSINNDLHIGDLAIAMGACTNSNFSSQYEMPGSFAPIADFDLVRRAVESCEKFGYNYKVGNVLSSDMFYHENPRTDKWINMGVLAVEMEIAALYMNAARSGNRALGICTISDHILTGEVTTAEERQNNFTHMMDVAFSLVYRIKVAYRLLQGQIDHVFLFEPVFVETLTEVHTINNVAIRLQLSLQVATLQTEYAIGQCVVLLFGHILFYNLC